MDKNRSERRAGDPVVSLVVDHPIGAAARHGLVKLRRALQTRGVAYEEVASPSTARGATLLIAGLPHSKAVLDLATQADVTLPEGPEALNIETASWQGRPAWLIVGSDSRGLMYALLDVAGRIGWASDSEAPLSQVRATQEQPFVRERSISIYTMHKTWFEQRLHDEAYWHRYLDTLAQNRFNTLALLFAYECAGYMAPPYPYFFTVPDFPDVRVPEMTHAHQQRNLHALNRLIAMCHERGLDFTLGIWDHIYRGGVQSGGVEGEAAPGWRVRGLTEANLMDYSVAALTELLELVPNVDTLQFRMHGESGLTQAEMDVFWARIYDVIVAQAPQIRFDARAKGFPDHLIDLALEKGVNIRICTKYWMEQMGLPFHPTHIHPQNQHDRRHGYADLLRYPKRYSMLWRLWNGGTNRVLLWGDPDYVRRFAGSTHLYDGDGFDINEPLATKMLAQDHDAEAFDLLTGRYRFYDYEFERYWHFFQLFGRLGYNPDTPAEIWEREFRRRFGEAGAHVARGLHLASKILPRIVAYNYPYHLFPTTRGWIEKERMDDLPTYATALPSDTQQFLSIADEARNRLEGGESAKIRPQASGAWFAQIAEEVLAQVAKAKAQVEDSDDPELLSTLADLKILAHLARYHAERVEAGVQWALFDLSQDLNALDGAIAHEQRALEAWEDLVGAAGDVYADDLMMGLRSAGLSGHWRDELAALRDGLEDLQIRRRAYRPPKDVDGPWIAHVPVRKAMPGKDLILRATISNGETPINVRIRYSTDGDASGYAEMTLSGEAYSWGGCYSGVIPASAVAPGLSYTLEVTNAAGDKAAYPNGDTGPIAVAVTADDQPPAVQHTPVSEAPASEALRIEATVTDPSGVKWVRLRYRSVTQYQDYRTLEMAPTDEADRYEATVPAEHVDPQWDIMYFIEAMDDAGNGCIHPDLEIETPYIIVRLVRSQDS
ncbi:MAG: hypothetical protein ACP5JG_16020 [Anaerolineae bacterium]